MLPREAQEFLGNAWAPIANLSGVSREEIMGQARRGALPAGVLVSQGAMSAVEKFLEKGRAVDLWCLRDLRCRYVGLYRVIP